jgi:spermidine synthase
MRSWICAITFAVVVAGFASVTAREIHEVTSPYHHIRVLEQGGTRTLCFDDATQTRMSLQDPLKGHFEYTEFLHMPFLWNTNLTNVLMIGLGGGSAQLAFERYYPRVTVTTVEIDPVVVQVASNYFQFRPSARQKVRVEDGRIFLRRNMDKYDLIVLDAYVKGRYGSSIPQHLATREFFQLVRYHLTTNGTVAFNVIGNLSGWRMDIVGAVYQTMKSVFPQVYIFPARSSQNIVFVATMDRQKLEVGTLRQRAQQLVASRFIKLPSFRERLESFRGEPPPNAARCPVLTDDYAPVEGLAAGEK